MYFDRRLCQLTRGLRGWIAAGIGIGLAAAAFGIARFTILGTLLALVFAGAGTGPIALAAAGVAAAVICAQRSTMCARSSRTAPRRSCRTTSAGGYDKIAELGPAWFAGERTGGVMLSVVDGVEQLQTFSGQYVPQVCVAALTPIAIFLFIVWWELTVACVMLSASLATLFAPMIYNSIEGGRGRVRHEAMKGSTPSFSMQCKGLPT